MHPDALEQLMHNVVMAPAEDRHNLSTTACPPHVRKNWLLGCARRERLEARKQSVATVTEALWKSPRFVFTEEGDAWTQCSTTDMSPEDLAAAQIAWKEADALELADDALLDDEDSDLDAVATDKLCHPKKEDGDLVAVARDRLCHPETEGYASGVESKLLSIATRKKMDHHMRVRLK